MKSLGELLQLVGSLLVLREACRAWIFIVFSKLCRLQKRSYSSSCANRLAVSRVALLGPGIRWMMHPDWMGVIALLTIIVSVTVIGYREGHSVLKRRV